MAGRNELITTAELADILGQADLRLFDCTTYLEPAARGSGVPYHRRARTAHLRGRAYSGRGFSRSAGRVLRPDTELRFMMPDVAQLEARVRPSRRRQRQPRRALFSIGTPMWATRFWWMLKSLGFENARGARRRPRQMEGSKAARSRPDRRRDIRRRPSRQNRSAGYFVDKHDVLAASAERDTVVVNALGPQFHKGLEPSRYGRPGRIPGSCNVSAATLLDPADQGLRAARGRRSEIRGAGHHARTSAWSPIAAAASRPPSICSCCTGSATTTSRSMTARWANGPRMTSLPIETG